MTTRLRGDRCRPRFDGVQDVRTRERGYDLDGRAVIEVVGLSQRSNQLRELVDAPIQEVERERQERTDVGPNRIAEGGGGPGQRVVLVSELDLLGHVIAIQDPSNHIERSPDVGGWTWCVGQVAW